MKITIDLDDHSEHTRTLIAKETSVVLTLSSLVKDDCFDVKVEAIKNQNTTAEILIECLEDENLLPFIASHRNANSEIIEKLYNVVKEWNNENRFEIFKKLAAHPNTPLEVLWEIWNTNKSVFIWKEFLKNRKTPAEILSKIYYEAKTICLDENMVCYLYRLLANHYNTPVKILSKLAKYDNDDVKEAVARNSNTNTETLLELARESVHLYWIVEKKHSNLLPRWKL